MKKPLLFRLPASHDFQSRIFFRFYHPVEKKWHTLFSKAPLKAAPGVVMNLLPTDFMHGLIAFTGVYESELTTRLARSAREGGLLVDVGANAGYFSLIWAALNPANHVLAFEASPRNVAILGENIEMNGLTERIHLHALALGKDKGMLPFNLGPEEQTGWGGITLEATETSIEVPVERLDNLIGDDVQIDVMKVDVEGADTWVIMGAEKLLRNKQVKVLYYEQNKTRLRQLGINENDAAEYLATLGYRARPVSPVAADIVDWVAEPES